MSPFKGPYWACGPCVHFREVWQPWLQHSWCRWQWHVACTLPLRTLLTHTCSNSGSSCVPTCSNISPSRVSTGVPTNSYQIKGKCSNSTVPFALTPNDCLGVWVSVSSLVSLSCPPGRLSYYLGVRLILWIHLLSSDHLSYPLVVCLILWTHLLSSGCLSYPVQACFILWVSVLSSGRIIQGFPMQLIRPKQTNTWSGNVYVGPRTSNRVQHCRTRLNGIVECLDGSSIGQTWQDDAPFPRLQKTYCFWATGSWIHHLGKQCRCPAATGHLLLGTRTNTYVLSLGVKKSSWTGNSKHLSESAAYPMPLAHAVVHAWSTWAGHISADLQLSVSKWTFQQPAGMTTSCKDVAAAAAEASFRRKPRGARKARGQQTLPEGSHSASVSDNPWGNLDDNPWGNLDDLQVAPAEDTGENPWGDLASREAQDLEDSQNPWGDLSLL